MFQQHVAFVHRPGGEAFVFRGSASGRASGLWREQANSWSAMRRLLRCAGRRASPPCGIGVMPTTEVLMNVQESILIHRPPEEVFAFFDDRANDMRWMGSVIESEWSDDAAETRVGRRGRMVMNAMGRREFFDEVTDHQEGRRVAHRSVAGSMVIHTACIAEPEGDGSRVTVTYEAERLPGGPFGKLLAPLTARMVRRNYRSDLETLKRILEAEPRADR
jgi:uncharacterized membrane protein